MAFTRILFSISCVLLHSITVHADLVKDYEKTERPLAGGPPLQMTIQIEVISLSAIEEHDFTYSIDMYMRHWWTDPRLSFSKNISQLETNIPPSEMIWVPSLAINNLQEARLGDNMRTIIKQNGDVYWVKRIRAKCSCKMDLRKYPMDTQTCPLILEDFTFPSSDLQIHWNRIPLVVPDILDVPGYAVQQVSVNRTVKIYHVGGAVTPYDNLIMYIRAKRTFTYFLYRVYIPSVLLMVFNMASYWIPDNAVPARVGLIVTTFLTNTFILQSVTEQTVKVPYTTSLQMFLLANVVLLVQSIVEYLIVLYLKQKNAKRMFELKETSSIDKNDISIDKKLQSISPSTHIVDWIARITVPVSYLLFLTIYLLDSFDIL